MGLFTLECKSNVNALAHAAAIDKIKVGHLKQVPTFIDATFIYYLVRKKRLELLRLTTLVPKTSASTNSATLAFI